MDLHKMTKEGYLTYRHGRKEPLFSTNPKQRHDKSDLAIVAEDMDIVHGKRKAF